MLGSLKQCAIPDCVTSDLACLVLETASNGLQPLHQDHHVCHFRQMPDKPEGKEKGKKGKGKKGPKEEDGAQGEEELGLAEEVTATPQVSTDVSAFVAVLRRRGFVLQGEPDVGNKMFVRMRFSKALPAARGKCVKMDGGQEKRPRFIDDEGAQITAEEEGRVLKPCVYTTR